MGYSEVYCHICGISFNIGRIRRPDEPRIAGWRGEGGMRYNSFAPNWDYQTAKCRKLGGCQVTKRPGSGERDAYLNPRPVWYHDGGFQDEEEHDGEFQLADPEPELDEPYELQTPPESEDELEVGSGADVKDEEDEEDNEDKQDEQDEEGDVTMTDVPALEPGNNLQPGTGPDPSSVTPEMLYRQFDRSINPKAALPWAEEFFPLPTEGSLQGQFDKGYEHIAGPDCVHMDGYNGFRISLREMRGCTTLQCLVNKPPGWEPDETDEDFEAETSVFLSGISDHMPSRDDSAPKVRPARHGCLYPPADNCLWDEDRAADCAMPFHPTCFEVYKRCCLRRFGHVDIEALMDWFRLEADYRQFHAFPRDPAVGRGSEQSWNHIGGDEFLAANPCFVPALSKILKSPHVVGHDGADYHRGVFGPDASAFGSASVVVMGPTSGKSDPFARLPAELRDDILSHLDSKDIGNLRLCSRALYQLPQSTFHGLLKREAPWLWEAWTDRPYSPWVGTVAKKLKDQSRAWDHRKEELEKIIDILAEEGKPNGENEAAIQAVRDRIRQEEATYNPPFEPIKVPLLPRAGTDWFQLCLAITKQGKDIKGLRNRQRIWKDCEEILDRIEAYQRKGKMGQGITVNPVETVQISRALSVRRNKAWANYCRAGRPNGEYIWEDWEHWVIDTP
jgi:hypothetical protein